MERLGLTSYDAMYLAFADVTWRRLRDARPPPPGRGRPARDRLRWTITASRKLPAPYEHDVTWPKYKGASAYLAKLRAEARDAATE